MDRQEKRSRNIALGHLNRKGWVEKKDSVRETGPEQPVRQRENQESELFWKLREGSVVGQILLMGYWGVQCNSQMPKFIKARQLRPGDLY